MENNKFLEIKKSMGEDFPPKFTHSDNSIFRNCYSHALNLWYESLEALQGLIYNPGCLTALANGSDIFFDVEEEKRKDESLQNTLSSYDTDLLIKRIKRDCNKLNLNVSLTNLDKPSGENSYKVIFCIMDISKSSWHFLRESILENGKKVWTHKPAFLLPACPVNFICSEKNVIFIEDEDIYHKYLIKAIFEISKK